MHKKEPRRILFHYSLKKENEKRMKNIMKPSTEMEQL
jgi:hypothetical protein